METKFTGGIQVEYGKFRIWNISSCWGQAEWLWLSPCGWYFIPWVSIVPAVPFFRLLGPLDMDKYIFAWISHELPHTKEVFSAAPIEFQATLPMVPFPHIFYPWFEWCGRLFWALNITLSTDLFSVFLCRGALWHCAASLANLLGVWLVNHELDFLTPSQSILVVYIIFLVIIKLSCHFQLREQLFPGLGEWSRKEWVREREWMCGCVHPYDLLFV